MPREQPTATNPRDWANALAEVPLFSGLTRRHLNKIAGLGRIRHFHDGAAIVRAGEPGDTLYVVLDGNVAVRRPGITELVLGMGSFFGEMALLDGGGRSATVTAKGPVLCLTIAQSQFFKLLKSEPPIGIQLLRELASRLRAAQAAS